MHTISVHSYAAERWLMKQHLTVWLLVVQVWKTLFDLGESQKGRDEIAKAMRVCRKLLKSTDDVAALADWASSAWDYMVSSCKIVHVPGDLHASLEPNVALSNLGEGLSGGVI